MEFEGGTQIGRNFEKVDKILYKIWKDYIYLKKVVKSR